MRSTRTQYILFICLPFFLLAACGLPGCNTAENCGGIAGLPCPDNMVCIDDPTDDCDPQQGDADCFGICVKGLTSDNQSLEKLYQSRDTWNAHNINAYSYTYRRSCECLPDSTRKVVITVSGNEISGITYADSGETVPESPQGFYQTVDDLFGMVEDAFYEKAHQISVTYDETYGYPTDIYIDYDSAVADEECIVATGDLTFL